MLDGFEPIQLTCITCLYDVKSVFAAMDGQKNLAPPFLKKAPPLKNKGGALAPPFRKKRVVACPFRADKLSIRFRIQAMHFIA